MENVFLTDRFAKHVGIYGSDNKPSSTKRKGTDIGTVLYSLLQVLNPLWENSLLCRYPKNYSCLIHRLRRVASRNVWSGRWDSNPRPQPWQGCALPLSYARRSPMLLSKHKKCNRKRRKRRQSVAAEQPDAFNCPCTLMEGRGRTHDLNQPFAITGKRFCNSCNFRFSRLSPSRIRFKWVAMTSRRFCSTSLHSWSFTVRLKPTSLVRIFSSYEVCFSHMLPATCSCWGGRRCIWHLQLYLTTEPIR